MLKRISNQFLRQLLFLLLIIGLGILLFSQLTFFISAVLGAYTLYVLLHKPLRWTMVRWRWSKRLATVMLMVVSFIVLCIPLILLVQMLNIKIQQTLQNLPELMHTMEAQVRVVEQKAGIVLLTPDNLNTLTNWSLNETRLFLNATLDGLLLLLAAYFLLYFMLTEGNYMERVFFNWMPLKPENATYVKRQLHGLVLSNALGIPLMGILQGCTAMVSYWISGIEDPWLWFVITCFTGMLPVLGVALAYIPLSLLTIGSGMMGKGIFIFLYGALVVGSVDNIGRMFLLKKMGNTHPIVTLFGVVAGLKLFGFIGFIFGPILVSLFLLLIRLYEKEYGKKNTAEAHSDQE